MFGQYAALARVLALLLAAAGLFYSGWWVNGMRHENAALKATSKERAALDKALADERVKAASLDAQVQALLSREPAVRTIRETIRANPSPCVRPEPVTDGLSRALASANQAIAASLSNGVLPADADKAEQPDGRR